MRDNVQTRSLASDLITRSDESNESNDMIIEGYFALFSSQTELFPGAFEEIAQGAFDDTMDNDIRALHNHDTNFVLGRTKSETLKLTVDEKGLFGTIKINPDDSDAVNLYQRVRRGDVDQCSFGFNIIEEDTENHEDGSVKWTLRKIDLHEVSCVTFPAYSDTGIEARQKQMARNNERQLLHKKQKLKEKIKC